MPASAALTEPARTLLVVAALAASSTALRAPEAFASEPFVATDGAAAERLAEAIRYRTLARDEAADGGDPDWDAFHDFLARSFPLTHRSLEREAVAGHSLLYTWRGRGAGAAPILLMAHMDVVPADAGDGWAHDPFAGVIEQGVIWGRGALDDKLSVLGILEAVERLLIASFAPGRDVYLAFGHDEESRGAGAKAIARLLKQRGVRLDFVLDEGSTVTEGMMPGVERPVALIGLAEKGYLSVTLTAMSAGNGVGHSSMPPPDTPIERLARALARLADMPMVSDIRPPVSDMLDAVAPEMPFWQRLAMRNRWIADPLVRSELAANPVGNAMIRSTGVATIVSAGSARNVIPQSAQAVVNYRILPGDTVEGVLSHVRQAVDGLDIAVDYEDALHPPPVSDPESASYALLARTVERVFPEAVVAPALVIAATDSRVYGEPDTAIADNVYRFLPVSLDEEELATIHGVNQRLPVADYARVIRFYRDLLREAAP